MTIGVTQSRQRSVVVSSGQAKEDNGYENPATTSHGRHDNGSGVDPDKYRKKRRRRPLHGDSSQPSRAQIWTGLAVVMVSIFLLARYLALHRRDTPSHYARAQAILANLQASNAWHKQRGRVDDHDDDNNTKNNMRGHAGTWTRLDAEAAFLRHRLRATGKIADILLQWNQLVDQEMIRNTHGGIRWIRPYLLPDTQNEHQATADDKKKSKHHQDPVYFRVSRQGQHFQWQDEYQELIEQHGDISNLPGPAVDYTDPEKYQYPPLMEAPVAGYPHMTPLGDLMKNWDQDEDYHGTITETLLHFDFTNAEEMKMAESFREAMVPFKLTNVPELLRANKVWTDEYLNQEFHTSHNGSCQESPNHYFAFFTHPKWNEHTMGLPPTRSNDWTFGVWARHAVYADAKPLAADQPHFYWQAGVTAQERYAPPEDWSFITRDLPTFSATEPNFVMYHPENQKGIQCRFGERGVVAATHYDAGRNMVGMITGAKRYILSPPIACGKLGISTEKNSPEYRHSLLNFGHLKYLENNDIDGMSDEERGWLQRAATAPAVETVLKAGEILFIPSMWFHYIVSVQKSAQCNARSGVETERHAEFGGMEDVNEPNCRPAPL